MARREVNISVDPEFAALLLPPTDEEFNQLRENILSDGEVHEPLILWNGLIVDGHNRWRVIQEHPEIPYSTHEMIFFSRDEAMAWIIRKQLGRRNLPDYEKARLALRLKPILKEEAKKTQGARTDILQKSVKSHNTQKELAEAAGVSHDTIHKVEVIEAEAPVELREKARRGEVSINRAYNEVRKPKPVAEPVPVAPTYTISNLVNDISAVSDGYVQTVRQTLTTYSTMLQSAEDRQAVLDAIEKAKAKLEELEKLLK